MQTDRGNDLYNEVYTSKQPYFFFSDTVLCISLSYQDILTYAFNLKYMCPTIKGGIGESCDDVQICSIKGHCGIIDWGR